MTKRQREDDDGAVDEQKSAKRTKPSSLDRLSSLSDELLLKVLSFLPISQLVACQRLSHKYQKLAGDGQIWKSHYYNRFIRPRASRLPGLKDQGTSTESLHFASRASRWLEEEHLVKSGVRTNWKRQYKLRHNWSKGSCEVNEIPVAEQAAIPPILVQMHDGIIYTADQTDGLRAWAAKGSRQRVAQLAFPSSKVPRPPTALAIDAQSRADHDVTRVIVGFEDGSFSIYVLHRADAIFRHQYTHEPSSNGVISATAVSWPYAVTMTATQMLSLYQFGDGPRNTSDPPRLLHSLKSHTAWPPLSTSLRTTASAIVICVAYALPTYLSGWTVGMQEVKVNLAGDLLDSRIASAIDQHYRPLAFSTRPMMHHLGAFTPGPGASAALELRHIHSKPTSLSYTHPYLLVSHPDNTLTLYLVTSTADTLSISAGSRLWGHTSSISGAHVGGRGKAVSVSRRGDELRVWELEGGFASTAAKRRLASGDLSVQIKPTSQSGMDLISKAIQHRQSGTACGHESAPDDSSELTLTRGWIGFDDEAVVVLKERSQGRQNLMVYDFT
ncbi:hypothetical protein M409DRAFT_65599 [Zasmidium cellare ATCC 36951]|uniref:F-box domain-containing protein n=1 Tax=Zasmidium cellare ATCC 36951 TaxID=1080233 RepID=A0A6A6CQK7_ZASCE|nr:uncharacterized protein M409DRAFT_65599 [Zasmidium cellare ATCC 36951]KAF2168059.1 hypothetical protein M409DRAFT_65599 [Zasmidium cellare ATCC 36951]